MAAMCTHSSGQVWGRKLAAPPSTVAHLRNIHGEGGTINAKLE